jgi:hypothetical protein
MKRLSPSHELVVNDVQLLVRQQLASFLGDLFSQGQKAGFHLVCGCFRVLVVDRKFKKRPSTPLASVSGRLPFRGWIFTTRRAGWSPGREMVTSSARRDAHWMSFSGESPQCNPNGGSNTDWALIGLTIKISGVA